MDGCGFCAKSKQLLKDHIASGKIKMADAKDAPEGVRGFPYFLETATGQSHTGFPGTVKNLMDKLGVGGKGKSPGPSPFIPGIISCTKTGCPPGQKCNESTGQCETTIMPIIGQNCDPRDGFNNSGCGQNLRCDPKTKKCVNPSHATDYVGSKLSGGDIAGIVIGSVAGLVLLILLGMLIMKSGKKKGRKSPK